MTTSGDSGSSPFDPTIINENQNCLPERYEILKILGTGGMGKVLHARDRVLDREVAVKFLVDRYASDEVYAQRFLGEARAAASLNHPNIVQIYEFGHSGNCAYLVMEYVDGRSLKDLMAEFGHYGEGRAAELIDYACTALGAAHARGIVHRDVKPDNMMLTESGEFKLVDLGLAKNLENEGSHTQTGHAMGTPHYISPEQVLGAKIIDRRADIYSLGASLFCLATGKVPFEGSSSAHIMSRHLNDPLPDPRDVVPALSEDFCRIVQKAMAKDPARRHQDTEELQAALGVVRATAPSVPEYFSPDSAANNAVNPPSSSSSSIGPTDLHAVEAALARSIGPVAKVLVERENRRTASRTDLLQALSGHIVSDRDRRRFLRSCGNEMVGVTSEITSGALSSPAGPTAAVDPEVLSAVTRHLADRIGPMARVLVKREAATGCGLRDLAQRLADQIPDAESRRGFLSAVAQLG